MTRTREEYRPPVARETGEYIYTSTMSAYGTANVEAGLLGATASDRVPNKGSESLEPFPATGTRKHAIMVGLRNRLLCLLNTV